MRIGALFCVLLVGAACGVTPSSPTPSSSSLPATTSSACETIANAGTYTLAADVGYSQNIRQLCLTVSADNVTLDCAGHAVNGYVKLADGTTNVAIQNCVMSGLFTLTNVSNITISNSKWSHNVFVVNGHHVTFEHNQVSLTSDVSITGARPNAVIVLQNGGQNQIIGNTLDGVYTGHDLTGQGNDGPGADDGVELDNETGDSVRDNTIQNVFDAGIEGVDTVNATTISNNTITHAIVGGINSYWCTHWENDTISGNVVSDSLSAVTITYRTDGAKCDQLPTPAGWFVGNTIAANSLRNPIAPNSFGIFISLSSLGAAVMSNGISGNNLGTSPIVLLPVAGFSVGDGNTCGGETGIPGSIVC